MQDSTSGKSDARRPGDADATSKETLEDLERSEEDFGSDVATNDPGPSPDGALNEPDEIKDAGPM